MDVDARPIEHNLTKRELQDMEPRSFLTRTLTGLVLLFFAIILIGILAFFGYTGYKFAKKESEIEFDMDKMKGRMDHKPGTGTDFDKRRDLQIPKESIMKVDAPDAKDGVPTAKEPSIVSGSIVFDEE